MNRDDGMKWIKERVAHILDVLSPTGAFTDRVPRSAESRGALLRAFVALRMTETILRDVARRDGLTVENIDEVCAKGDNAGRALVAQTNAEAERFKAEMRVVGAPRGDDDCDCPHCHARRALVDAGLLPKEINEEWVRRKRAAQLAGSFVSHQVPGPKGAQ
jgi:hypothetical protein